MNGSSDCHEIPDCAGTCFVDAFRGRYLTELTKDPAHCFILTHYHGDHYGSLPREHKYQGSAVIHCTPVTAELLRRVHQVPSQFVTAHAYGQTWTHRFVRRSRITACGSRKRKVAATTTATVTLNTENRTRDEKSVKEDEKCHVQITFYDANHCPGAAIVVFELPDRRMFVHTGDMRYHPKMKLYPLLQQAAQERRMDLVFLDTTYGNPKHDFGAQEHAVNTIASHVQGLLQLGGEELTDDPEHSNNSSKTKTLVLLSCYSIGKERVLWETSRRAQQSIFVQERKHLMLQCIQEPNDAEQMHASSQIVERCTRDASQSDIHVIPMGMAGELWPYFRPNHWACADYARQLDKHYDQVVAFLPTGWAEATNWNKKNGVSRQRCHGIDVEIRLVAYSEHSSFSELQEFVNFLKPRQIVPTVYKDESDRRRIQARFKVDSQRAKQLFLRSFAGAAGGHPVSKESRKAEPCHSANSCTKLLQKPSTNPVDVIDLTSTCDSDDDTSFNKVSSFSPAFLDGSPRTKATEKSASKTCVKTKKPQLSKAKSSTSPRSITDYFTFKQKVSQRDDRPL